MAYDTPLPTLDDLGDDFASSEDVKDEPVEQEPTTEESSSEETTEPEAEQEEQPESDEESSTDEESEPTEEPEKPSPAEERKTKLNNEIRDLVTQRRELLDEVARLNDQVYAPQSIEQIMEEQNLSQVEARMVAMEQRQELADYNTRVAEAQLVIGNQSERVLRDFAMFNPESPEYNQQLAERAAVTVANALQRDPNTQQVTGSNIDIYQYYETIASAVTASAADGQIKGQRANQEMDAAAEPSTRKTPPTPKDDPFLTGLLGGKGYEKLRS